MGDSDPPPNVVIAALKQLTEPGPLTEKHFRETVAAYPELLSSACDSLLRAISVTHTTATGRRVAEAIANTLAVARVHGIDTAITAHVQTRTIQDREKRDQEARSASRQKRLDRKASETKTRTIETKLPSLSEAVDFIKGRFPPSEIELDSKSYDDGSTAIFRASWPRFLFRGESSAYPTTTSSLARLRTSLSIPMRGVEQIILASIGVRLALQKQFGIGRLLAEGFPQHYGYPTRFLDVTADLGVAASFASELCVGDVGCLCVLQTELLHRHSVLVDLRHHECADRPRRQHALAISAFGNGDLKNPETVELLGLDWVRFQFKEEDDACFVPDPALLDAHSDPAAGFAQLALGEYGKLEDNAAQWFAGRIPPAPTVGKTVLGEDGTLKVQLLAADQAGIEAYDEARQRRVNYELWSERYPSSRRQLSPELEPYLTQLDALPLGATLRILRPRVVGLEARKRQD